ncbi:muramidase (phage lysozyme)/glucan-binding YG repeat protein [Aminobacter ciceronei]|nr:muramidase (phage lysozyme)/glucan-binding YG repeat protein [Aminobacter ciceronei]
MGAAIGRGMQGLAAGVSQMGDALARVRELEDIAKAKEADNELAAWDREAKYGENGFMTLEGKAAVDGRADYEKRLADKQREIGKGLSPSAQQKYSQASQARVNSSLDQSILHTAQSRKKWFADASTARIDTFAEDALAGYQNPALVNKNIAAGQAELREMGALQGWDADTLKNREVEFISGVHKNIALRMAQTDPVAAKKYEDENKKMLTGPHQTDLEGVFAPLVIEEEAKRKTNEFFDSGKVPATKFAAADLPQQAYSLLGVIAGTEAPDYRTINGGAKFSDFSDHPRQKGAGGTSTAAGRYQFVKGTWDRVRSALGLPDFTPESQDRGAWWLAQADYKSRTGRELSDDLAAGRYSDVRNGLAPTWEGIAKLSNAQFAARMSKASGVAVSADPTEFLDGISNPSVRDATMQRIKAITSVREAQAKAQMDALKSQAFGFVDAGSSPDAIPAEVRAQLGREEMSGLWSYFEARAKGGQPKTDDRTLYDLQTMYAEDPAAFADIDMFKYRDRLSDDDWKQVNGWRQSALTDERKAREDGMTITAAFSQAQTQLEALGITTVGTDGSKRQAQAARIAEFNNALSRQMEEFKKAENKNPTQIDIQSMINRMLLPIVIEEEKSMWNPTKTPWSSTSKREGFLFEAGKIGDGLSVDVAVEYQDIPVDLRRGISTRLETELGRKPSEDEIVTEYEAYILNGG